MAQVKIPAFKLNNGRDIPAVGYSTWLGSSSKLEFEGTADIPRMVEALSHAIDIGYRHVDTAHVNRVEPEVGRVLNQKMKEGLRRDELFVTTKVWQHFHREGDVEVSLRGSLRRLDLDYVDMLLLHWPFSVSEDGVDEKIDYVQTWRGFESVLAKGLTKGIGVSNFNLDQMKRLLENCKIPPAINQIEINLNLGQTELVDYCIINKIQVVAHSPLGTMVPCRAAPGTPEPKLDNPIMAAIAEKHGKTVAQVTFRYLYQRGLVIVSKTVTKKHVMENAAIFDFYLDAEDVTTIAKFDVGYRTLRPIFYQDMQNYPFDQISGKMDIPPSLKRWKNGANLNID